MESVGQEVFDAGEIQAGEVVKFSSVGRANEQDVSRSGERSRRFLHRRNQLVADRLDNDEQVSVTWAVNLSGIRTLPTEGGEEVSAAASVERKIRVRVLHQLRKPSQVFGCRRFNVPSQKLLPSKQTRWPMSEKLRRQTYR